MEYLEIRFPTVYNFYRSALRIFPAPLGSALVRSLRGLLWIRISAALDSVACLLDLCTHALHARFDPSCRALCNNITLATFRAPRLTLYALLSRAVTPCNTASRRVYAIAYTISITSRTHSRIDALFTHPTTPSSSPRRAIRLARRSRYSNVAANITRNMRRVSCVTHQHSSKPRASNTFSRVT